MEFLWQLEQRYPVASWRVGDLHVWPLIRIQFANSVRAVDGQYRAATSLIQRAVHSLTAQQYVAIADRKHNAHLTHADVVFLSSATYRARVDGRWLDRLCDPLREQLEQQGLKCMHLEQLSHGERRIPRWRDSYVIQRDAVWRRFLAGISLQKYAASDIALEGLDDLLLDLAHRNLPSQCFQLENIQQQCALTCSFAAYFRRILLKARAKVAIVVCYYNKEGFGLNLAARQLGLPSLDLQHGVQGSLHFAYGPWTVLPPGGYEVLPDHFWCWTQQAADLINTWSANAAPRHTAFFGGNPWDQYWFESDQIAARAIRERLENCRARLGGARQILISLQAGIGVTQGLPKEISESIISAPADWRWWIRLHPAMAVRDATLRAWLSDLPSNRIEWRAASELPLPLLLTQMDAHITRSSSVVQEAASFGVPSVVTDPVGFSYYSAEAASGLVQYAQTGPDIIHALQHAFSSASTIQGPSQVLPWEQSIKRLRIAAGLT